jgi:hypothetical protein
VGEVEDVSFVQQNIEAFSYRDAVRFANGKEVLLQWLRFGQGVDVLSLSSAAAAEEQTSHQMREEAYRQLFLGGGTG